MCISMPVNIQRCTGTLILQTPSRACRLASTAGVTLGQTSSSNASSMMMDTAAGGAFEPASTSMQPAASARRRTIKATLQLPQPFAPIPYRRLLPHPDPACPRPHPRRLRLPANLIIARQHPLVCPRLGPDTAVVSPRPATASSPARCGPWWSRCRCDLLH